MSKISKLHYFKNTYICLWGRILFQAHKQFVCSRAEGPARLLRPQSRQTVCGLGTNPPPQKDAFKDSAMQRYCSLWVVVFETCSDRLYHHNTCVVVVHSYLQLRLIRHEWGVSFFNVGVSLKNYSRRLKEQSCASPLTLEWTNCLRAWNKILPHNACKRLS